MKSEYKINEERILETIKGSSQALSLDQIFVHTSSFGFISRQRMKKLLESLVEKREISRKIYTMHFSKKPRIESVISEVYYVREEQRQSYEKEDLPQLKKETRNALR